jgi:predicted transport protein
MSIGANGNGDMTVDDFFAGQAESRRLFDAVRRAIEAIGEAEVRVTKSQIAFRRQKAFARVWMPRQYLKGRGAPLVLTLGFDRRDESPRWKEIAEPRPGHFTHHLELRSTDDVDGEVREWLRRAWRAAT